MKRLLMSHALLAVLLLVAAACQPPSKHPLIDLKEAKQDTRLHGVWVSIPQPDAQEKDYHLLHIGPSLLPIDPSAEAPEPGAMQAWFINHTEKTRTFEAPLGMYFVSTPINKSHVASISEGIEMTTAMQANASKETKLITSRDKRFWFLRYEVNGDELKVWSMPDMEVIDRAIADGKLHGEVTRNEGKIEKILITDETPVLRSFFEESLDVLFAKDPAVKYRKVDVGRG